MLQNPALFGHWAQRVGIIHLCFPLPGGKQPRTPSRGGEFKGRDDGICFVLFLNTEQRKGGSFIRKTCPPKLVWAGSVNSCRLTASHWGMEKWLLSHFSTARASVLRKKTNIPHAKLTNYLLKREKEGQHRALRARLWAGPQGRDS